MTIYHTGDTIRLQATFKTWAGTLSDLTAAPSVKIYDAVKVQQGTTATATKSSTGVYYYEYTASTAGQFTYEFSGTLEGKAVLRRGSFTVGFKG